MVDVMSDTLLLVAGAVFGSCLTIIILGFWAAHEVAKQDARERTYRDLVDLAHGAPTFGDRAS